MSNLLDSNNEASDNTDLRKNGDLPPSTPRWVKVSIIIFIALVLIFFIKKLTGIGGNHGPGRHMHGGEPSEQLEQEAPTDIVHSGGSHK